VLGVALENLSAQTAVIPVIIRDDNGTLISNPGATISLGGNGHTAFLLSDPNLGSRSRPIYVAPWNSILRLAGGLVYWAFASRRPIMH
jgi:hypothetical protein